MKFKKGLEVELIEYMGSDLTVVNAARVSFGKESDWDEVVVDHDYVEYVVSAKDAKLIKFLAEHEHYSPFGHCFASFRIKAPIFVARQLVKHKFLRWNETSRRYVNDEPEFFAPDFRYAAANKKQGSGSAVTEEQQLQTSLDFLAVQTLTKKAYNMAIKEGVCPEQARAILPQNMITEWWWSGSLDAFAAMCNLRCKPDTQAETRVIADKISLVMSELYPVSWNSLVKGKESNVEDYYTYFTA
jgi:thymidylate synthase (FAD)